MMVRLARRVRAALDLRVLAILLALAGQLAVGAIVPPDLAAAERVAGLDAASVLCVGSSPTGSGTAPHRHHASDWALCPLTIAMAQHAAVLTPIPVMPPPPKLEAGFGAAERPPGRGPPPPSTRVGAPRAPPFLA